MRAPGTTVTRNDNHDLGISAIRRVIDGGGNRAVGNGNPAQCTQDRLPVAKAANLR